MASKPEMIEVSAEFGKATMNVQAFAVRDGQSLPGRNDVVKITCPNCKRAMTATKEQPALHTCGAWILATTKAGA